MSSLFGFFQGLASDASLVRDYLWAEAKEHVRSLTEKEADSDSDLLGKGANAKDKFVSLANMISDTAKNIADRLKGRDPAKLVSPCSKNPTAQPSPSTDKDFDGCLFGAGCRPTCKCGNNLKRSEIAIARANPVQPNPANNTCCAEKRAKLHAEGKPQRRITYTNGVQTSRGDLCETLDAIANQTCADVVGVYNATGGKDLLEFAADAAQTSQDRLLIKAAHEGKSVSTHDGRNPAVDSLSDLLVSDAETGQSTELWAHSQGGAITSLALFDARNTLRSEGLDGSLAGVSVKSFGSAAPYWPPGPKAEHFLNVNDLAPTALGLGVDPSNDASKAPGGHVIRFSGSPPGPYETISPAKNWVPAKSANHGMNTTYLGMEKQQNGGCQKNHP